MRSAVGMVWASLWLSSIMLLMILSCTAKPVGDLGADMAMLEKSSAMTASMSSLGTPVVGLMGFGLMGIGRIILGGDLLFSYGRLDI